MYQGKKIGAVIAAAGSGTRMDTGSALPKQFLKIGGVPMIRRTVMAFEASPWVDDICVVINGKFRAEYEEALRGMKKIRCMPVGGRQRQESVGEGLRRLAEESAFEYVMIHDGARPYVSDHVIESSLAAALKNGAAVAAVPVKDTIRRGTMTLSRSDLFAVQTPQTFARDTILLAYERAASDGFQGTDDGGLVERLGLSVALSEGDYANIKITTKEDLKMEYRIGTGYDVHRLEYGRRLVLGGVTLEHEKGLLGHSDADVLLHAIMDALLGAAALGDIGKHFPDTDPRYKDISSLALLRETAGLLADAGCATVNVDATLIAQRPKVAAHMDEMRRNIADALGIPLEKVSVKATTTEKLGFAGREEGIAAEAVALISGN